MEMIRYMFGSICSENTLFANKASAKGRPGTKEHLVHVCEQSLKSNSRMFKSQAVAFLLGFTLTSVVLLCIPGLYKKNNQGQANHKSAKPAVETVASYRASHS